MKQKIARLRINLEDIKESLQLFFRFNKYIIRYWKLEVGALLIANTSIALGLVVPYIGKNILDKGILARNLKVFIIFTLLAAAIYLVNLIIGNIHRIIKNYVIRKVKITLARDVFGRIRQYSLRLFQNQTTGGFIFRVNNDVTAAANIINDTLPNIISTVFRLILITAIIIFINWKIILLIIAYHLLILLQINLFIKRIEFLIKLNLEKTENIFKRLNELFSHIYIIKAFGNMVCEVRMYFHDLIEVMRIEIDQTRLSIVSGLLRNISNKLFFGLIGFYGSFLVIRGEMSLGGLGAVMAYISQGMSAYSSLLNLGQQIVLNRVSLHRVREVLDAEIEIKEGKGIASWHESAVEFYKVNFGYQKDRLVLRGINFTIPSDSHIAIAGLSGSGKTTILNLILRLYDVQEGEVRLGGYCVKSFTFKSIYNYIGIASQEPFLWDRSIRENISYAKKDATERDLYFASQTACICEFIESLPEGFDTVIGENACRLSQGQKQRIAIARAVLRRPRILMIDEAMSSLDSETEDKIITNLRYAFKGSTLIVISHRLSTIKKMDAVYFIENKERMVIGSHQMLCSQNKKYRDLFASQIE